MQDTKDAALVRHNGGGVAPHMPTSGGTMAFLAKAQEMYRLAETIASSDVIPDTFRRKPSNVFMALEIATRLDLGVFEVMQCLYPAPGGKYGFESRYVIGLANKRGPFDGPIWYEESGQGDGFTVTAKARIKATGQVTSYSVSMAMARREGWAPNGKKTKSGKPVGNPKYESMPGLMLRYRAATLLIRTTCPEVLLGMHTREELEDVHGFQGPRHVEAEPQHHDPLDDTLTPIAEPSAPEYLPDDRVQAMIRTFTDMGIDYSEVLDRMGDPEKVTVERYREMEGWYKELRAARDSHQEPDEEEYLRPEPSNLYGAPEDAPEYD